MRTQQEDVAGKAFDGEVFIQRANSFTFRFGNHGILRGFGNGSAGSDRREFGTAPSAHAMVNLIAVQQRSTASTRSGNAFGQHVDHGIEISSRQVPVRVSGAHQGEQFVLSIIAAGRLSHDLLRQNIQRILRDFEVFQIAFQNGMDERGAFHQFVACRGKKDATRQCAHPVTGPPHALQADGDGAGGPELDHQIHRADIDAEFQ